MASEENNIAIVFDAQTSLLRVVGGQLQTHFKALDALLNLQKMQNVSLIAYIRGDETVQ